MMVAIGGIIVLSARLPSPWAGAHPRPGGGAVLRRVDMVFERDFAGGCPHGRVAPFFLRPVLWSEVITC